MRFGRLVVACIAVVAAPIIAVAGPGDPRLVNGVLEWPRTVTNEPFVIVRGDDGVLYYVGIAATRRDGTVTTGARVSVLGIEGRNAHEITAVGFGSGATTEAAFAQLQAARTPAAAPPATPAPAAAAPAAPAAVATPASPAGVAAPVAPAPAVAPAAPAAVAAPATPGAVAPTPAAASAPPTAAPATPAPVATPTAPAVTATPSTPAAVSPKPAAPAPAQTAHAAAAPPTHAAPAPAATTVAPSSGSAGSIAVPPGVVPTAAPSPTAPPIAATAPMIPVDDRRWTEVSGEIEAFMGRTVVLKVDGGRVTVDVSSLSGNLERMVAPGTKVKFYGVPVELRFKAMGFIDPDVRGRR